ncbi:MAG: hypothetical protein PHN75_08915 [Syntrophales bacterium]|nr:hypothetical protein [Syntrophales bacterium]
MGRKIGLWIDNSKAVIMAIADQGETLQQINSSIEKRSREALYTSADDSQARKFIGPLNMYYYTVMATLRDADSLFIFGPGEAKLELKRRLEKDNIRGHIIDLETTDKMTEDEIVAKVRSHFQKESPHQGMIRIKYPEASQVQNRWVSRGYAMAYEECCRQ